MKNKERLKQIFLSFIAISLILLGYANYSLNNNEAVEVASRTSNEINIGDVELVNGEPMLEEVYSEGIVSNDELNTNIIAQNYVSENYIATENSSNYFEDTRIQRDSMYSETLETYQKLIESNQTPNDQKAIAVQEVSNLTSKKNSIIIAENLIKNKGFKDVVILENNGNVSVIVKSTSLTQEQISQIQNIIERELNVSLSNISISNK